MTKIVTTEEMRAIEKAADADGHSYATMMDLAGQAVTERILLATAAITHRPPRVVVLVGGGNNGGDGLVAARYTKEHYPEAEVSAYMIKARDDKDEVFAAARDAGVFIVDFPNDKQNRVLKNLVAGADVLVDALFGTGTHLPIKDEAAQLLSAVKGELDRRAEAYPKARSQSTTAVPDDLGELEFTPTLDHIIHEVSIDDTAAPYVIAVDCPSGLDCDTGELDDHAIPADETVTFAAAKTGQFRFPGAAAVGELFIADIGIPPKQKELKAATLGLIDAATVRSMLPARPDDSHKGTFGKAYIVAGSINYIGAAYLAAASAYRVGAGLVTLGVPQGIISPLASQLPEATWTLLPNNMGVVNKAAAKIAREESDGYSAMLVGCGIGDEDDTREFIEALLTPETETKKATGRALGLLQLTQDAATEEASETGELPPLVIDADGLNVLAKIENWWKSLPENTILTPHPREFARLAGIEDTAEVQANRVDIAREYAAKWKTVVVLKGAYTVVAAPNGDTFVSPFASAKLATAGTGDVLAGTIVGLLAQGLSPVDAGVTGVWLHGWAGTYGTWNSGSLASDVMFALGEAVEAVK